MPCGGIFPVQAEDGVECFYCEARTPAPDHFCEEWDALLHGKCVEPFLKTAEGKIVVEHNHLIVVEIDGVRKTLLNGT